MKICIGVILADFLWIKTIQFTLCNQKVYFEKRFFPQKNSNKIALINSGLF